jgi:ribosomal protein S27AE
MVALDGNAIAGPLFEHFGAEMTMASGSCTHCGASALLAELVVYSRAPGTVARCPACGNVVIVLVDVRGTLQVDSSALRLLEAPA